VKKILHIQVLPILSGVQRISLEILQGLPSAQYEKYIVFSNDTVDEKMKNDCIETFTKSGIKVIVLKHLYRKINLQDIAAFKEIYQLCKKEKFDIVHTHSTKPGIVGRIAAKLAGVPLVIHTVHGLAFHKYVKFPRWQFYWLCEMIASIFCNRIILVNNYYSKYFRFFRNKTITVYNGVDFSSYQDKC
jgi:hypothetical protein